MIDFLEKSQQSLNEKKLNYFIDQRLENLRHLFKLESQQTDMNYFNDLIKQIFSS